MEITYQNNQEDFDAYYDYFVEETKEGRKLSWQRFFGQQIFLIITLNGLTYVLSSFGSGVNKLLCGGLLLFILELFVFMIAQI